MINFEFLANNLPKGTSTCFTRMDSSIITKISVSLNTRDNLESQQLRCNILANMGYYSIWDADFKMSSHNLYWRNQFTKFKSVKQRISKAAKP